MHTWHACMLHFIHTTRCMALFHCIPTWSSFPLSFPITGVLEENFLKHFNKMVYYCTGHSIDIPTYQMVFGIRHRSNKNLKVFNISSYHKLCNECILLQEGLFVQIKRQKEPRGMRSQKCRKAGIKSTVLFISWADTLLAGNWLGEKKTNTHVELNFRSGWINMVASV